MRVNTTSLKNEIKNLKQQMDKEVANQDYKTGYFSALSTVEGVIAMIEEEETHTTMRETAKKLSACPDIPRDKKYWGKVYQSKCTCGGTITASRSTLNGHLHAVCDKCHWNIIE